MPGKLRISIKLLFILLLIFSSVTNSFAGIHFGPISAIKSKAKELKEKKDKRIEAAQPPSTGFLHIEDKKVIDKNGQEVFLRGFNSGVFRFASYKDYQDSPPGYPDIETINDYNDQNYKYNMTEDDIKDMKTLGANVIRAHSYLEFWALETEPYQYNDGFIQTLDDFISLANNSGLYVIITLTSAGQSEKGRNLQYYGGAILWSDEDFRQRVISAWKYIAEHYADNPGVAGYDILNEPSPPTKEALHSFYSEVINEIREVDQNHIIILERNHFFNRNDEEKSSIYWGGEYEDDNIMLQIHRYNDCCDIEYYEEEYDTRDELDNMINELLSNEQAENRPMFLGEFSALWTSEERGLQWTRDILYLMNKYGIHYAYFAYKKAYHIKQRSLYRATEWWLRDWTTEQQENLELTTEQRERLLTSNYVTYPELREVLEEGFKGETE